MLPYAHAYWIIPRDHFGRRFMDGSVPCQLCQQPVPLESARINELGKAVHEECYLNALRIGKPAQREPLPKPGTA